MNDKEYSITRRNGGSLCNEGIKAEVYKARILGREVEVAQLGRSRVNGWLSWMLGRVRGVMSRVADWYLPPILLSEGQKIFIENLGLAGEKLVNGLLLLGMGGTVAARFWINPLFNASHREVDHVWLKAGEYEDDGVFYDAFYGAVGNFMKVLLASVMMSRINFFLEELLGARMMHQKRREFEEEWLSHGAAYGVRQMGVLGSDEGSRYKKDLSLVELSEDFEVYRKILSLWNSRIVTTVDFVTAYWSLVAMSSFLSVNLYVYAIGLPWLFTISVGYSMGYNSLMSLFEAPISAYTQAIKHLQDLIVAQIMVIETHAEQIILLNGERFEANKLQDLRNRQWGMRFRKDVLCSLKSLVQRIERNSVWLIPIFATIREVREGAMSQEAVGPAVHNCAQVNEGLQWARRNFSEINKINHSLLRIQLFQERMGEWEKVRGDLEARVRSSEKIIFDGKLYKDGDFTEANLLAQGCLELQPGRIYHFDAPSGSGKTTLFRVLARMRPHFSAKECSLPKEHTVFLPSRSYILGLDEPLIQSVIYPLKYSVENSALNMGAMGQVKVWLVALKLPGDVIGKLESLSFGNSEGVGEEGVFDWVNALSDGERKRIVFVNILLKLRYQRVKFLILDEPFEGLDRALQKKMVGLLREVIKDSRSRSRGCTILYSSHKEDYDNGCYGLNDERIFLDAWKNLKIEPAGKRRRESKCNS